MRLSINSTIVESLYNNKTFEHFYIQFVYKLYKISFPNNFTLMINIKIFNCLIIAKC